MWYEYYSYPSATGVSNYQYEQKLQEQKTDTIDTARFIEDFVKEFEKKIKEGIMESDLQFERVPLEECKPDY